MARQREWIHGFQRSLLVLAVLQNPVVETRRHQLERDWLVALVFPEPAMDARARRQECRVGLVPAGLVVEFVALEIVGAFFARRLDVRLAVELERQLRARLPREDEAGAF